MSKLFYPLLKMNTNLVLTEIKFWNSYFIWLTMKSYYVISMKHSRHLFATNVHFYRLVKNGQWYCCFDHAHAWNISLQIYFCALQLRWFLSTNPSSEFKTAGKISSRFIYESICYSGKLISAKLLVYTNKSTILLPFSII